MPTTVHETKQILDDAGKPHAYTVFRFGAREGFALQPRIAKAIGDAGGALIDGLKGIGGSALDADVAKVDGASIGRAVTLLAERVASDGDLAMDLLKYAIRDGKQVPEVYDEVYAGNYGELYRALFWIVEVNYGAAWRRPFALLLATLKARSIPESSVSPPAA